LPLFTYSVETEQATTRPKSALSKAETTQSINRTRSGSLESNKDIHVSHDGGSDQAGVSDPTSIYARSDCTMGHKFLPQAQPTCPICLDDFESGVTPIRELPCGHIFHPDCSDAFLSNNSSLCPMCKTSILPVGYCPVKITNTMVRRERALRRLRSRVVIRDRVGDVENGITTVRLHNLGLKVKRAVLRRPADLQIAQQTQTPISTMTGVSARPTAPVAGDEAPAGTESGLSRQAIARRRMQELAAPAASLEEVDVVPDRQRPKWRRMFAAIFPGFS